MTARNKAVELIKKYTIITEDKLYDYKYSKQCALIAIDLAIQFNDLQLDYLYAVKQEIQQL